MLKRHTGEELALEVYGRSLDEKNLLDVTPMLLQLLVASANNVSVAEVMVITGEQIQWNINFSPAAHDWEMDSFATFFNLFYSFKPSYQHADLLWWILTHKGLFTVRSFYKSISQELPAQFPWKRIWRHKAPLKAAIFVWTASLDKILTTDNLRK